MTRRLIPTSAFERALARLLKRQPTIEPAVTATLARLAADASDPRLKTHKLKGRSMAEWSCSVNRDLRITFDFVQDAGAEAILLHTIGTHDEVS